MEWVQSLALKLERLNRWMVEWMNEMKWNGGKKKVKSK